MNTNSVQQNNIQFCNRAMITPKTLMCRHNRLCTVGVNNQLVPLVCVHNCAKYTLIGQSSRAEHHRQRPRVFVRSALLGSLHWTHDTFSPQQQVGCSCSSKKGLDLGVPLTNVRVESKFSSTFAFNLQLEGASSSITARFVIVWHCG